jgi:L-2-hydroxyglutarate oxidase
MVEYCRDHGIDHAVSGKVVVALDAEEATRLRELERRCAVNAVRAEMIGPERLAELEPHIRGVAALHVLDTGIVDYGDVCRSLAHELEAGGTTIRVGASVISGWESADGLIVETSDGPIEAKRVVTCAGLHADDVAEAISGPGGAGGLRVMAFRGEYQELVAARAHLVRGLVYPVPDPDFPFLGVHLTVGSTATSMSDRTRSWPSHARAIAGAPSVAGTSDRRSDFPGSVTSRARTGGSGWTRWVAR